MIIDFIRSCWSIWRSGRAWQEGLVVYSMMAEEEWQKEGIDHVEVTLWVHIPEKITCCMATKLERD